MSAAQSAAGGRQTAHASSRVSLPAFPQSPLRQSAHYHDDGQPLPDHFPEPCTADPHLPQPTAHPPVNTPQMAHCPSKHVVRNQGHEFHNGGKDPDEATEGLRRITDKYAAPSMLHVDGSVCSSDTYSSSVSPVETWPASTSPSTTHSVSPTPSGMFGSLVLNGAHTGHPHGTPASSASVHSITARQNGSAQRLAPLSTSAFSDASSDMSDASPSPAFTGSIRSDSTNGGKNGMLGVVGRGRYQSVSGIALSTSLGDGVSDEDVQQVEMFYRSHKTEVTVCHSLANLYFGTIATNTTSTPGSSVDGRLSPVSGGDLWEFVTTGIPLLVLDSGDHHRARQLSLVVAEKGTGFVLWKDVVSHLTSYLCLHANFHTLRISSDSNKLAGLSFDDSKAAAEFASIMQKLTSDPEDELLMLSKKGKKKKKKKQESKKAKFKPPKKTDISQPCCFQHVTKLERPQITGLTPLPPNGFPPAPAGSLSSLTDVFQDRLIVSASRARSPSSEFSDASVEH